MIQVLTALLNKATVRPWSIKGLTALLRFGHKQDGPWNSIAPDEEGQELPATDVDAALICLAMNHLPELLQAKAESDRIRTETAKEALKSLYLYGMNGRGPGGLLFDIIKLNRPDIAAHLSESESADETWAHFFGEEDK